MHFFHGTLVLQYILAVSSVATTNCLSPSSVFLTILYLSSSPPEQADPDPANAKIQMIKTQYDLKEEAVEYIFNDTSDDLTIWRQTIEFIDQV